MRTCLVWSVVIFATLETAWSKGAEQPPQVVAIKKPPRELVVDLGGGVKMEFVLIPAGSFMMGDEKGGNNEKPVHKVTITKPYYLGKYEVTQEQWKAVMGGNVGDPMGSTKPVENVSWNDCQEFLKKLTAKTNSQGVTFMLPTEAQWEYACRAGTTTRWSFGGDPKNLANYAWYDKNSDQKTHQAGQKSPNAWGLYDMHGNVWEWCADFFGKDYYEKAPAVDPRGPAAGPARVLRGGSFCDLDPDFLRCASRDLCSPECRYGNYGFRVARTVTP